MMPFGVPGPTCTAARIMTVASLAAPVGCARRGSDPVVMLRPPVTETPPAEVPATGSRLDEITLSLEPVVDGFRQPLLVTNAGDGAGRLFIVEKAGLIKVMRDGDVLSVPFLDLSGAVSTESERGLLGLAFSPEYKRNGRFYVNYTDRTGTTVVSRFSVSPADADVAQPETGQVLLRIEQPFANHNGGGIAFDPDGHLLIGMGDGGSAGDPQGNGQDPHSPLGKMLRIDVGESGEPPRGDPYGIPADNPWAEPGSDEGPLPEIWALGLRNPWRFSFDRETGDLWIGDVGQGVREEIDFEPAGSSGGLNFGWNVLEGTQPYPPGSDPGDTAAFTMPVIEYAREAGQSVTGGYVYRGDAYPRMRGVYLYGDFGSGRIWGLVRNGSGWENRLLLESGLAVVSFGEAENGEVYVVDFGGGVYRVTDE